MPKPGYAVIDSLLGDGVELYDADKWLQPPKDFAQAPDSILKILQEARAASVGDDENVKLTHCFLDTASQSGLVITLIKQMNLEADTAGFIARYREVLDNLYGPEGVVEDTHWADDGKIFIRTYAVSDGIIARYQVICLSMRGNGIELNYFAPEGHFQEILPAITSSLGTVKALPRSCD